ncbi:Serine/threonine-protein kinase PRP4 homolog (PRP4 pre-mRNA-processing factor 4 homolog) (Pre-mRNA protein kinase) [Durusdinium trenchii]|uniref:Serine/threonine-protein kinase PRP4 homolog (PRP4 pre-mRNA-processing factor 4 homolog) (Pre-mRNA protein kinase) n=1 Tax=Durusdinium trenchii TaxID=1381693 RepID=A0ABP0L0J6_9DINO
MGEGRSRSPNSLPWGLLKKQLHPGCKVRLKGLHVQRNGQIGIVEDYLPPKQRWRVRLGSGKSHDFKAENLHLEEPAERPPPPGWVGPETERGAVVQQTAFREEETVEKKPEMQIGSMVVLHGLKSAAELNDQRGEIESFVQESSRWRVKLLDGAVKDLKAENLRLLDAKESEVFSELAALEAELDTFRVEAGDACGPQGRFVVEEKLGEGTFSTVFRCRDAENAANAKTSYAVKFTRANEQTRRALEREVKIMSQLITKLAPQDPEGMRCILCLAFFETFVHQGRLAAVFELMKCNLRTALAKYGAGRGLPLLPTVRDFGRQLFLALRLLRNAQLFHCDVKPENLLLAADNSSIKLCDFGSCHGPAERLRSDQLMPRNYRAPEIMLGQDYGFPVDMWSAAATIFELATDTVLFQGENNNEMLYEMMRVCGPFPLALVLSGHFSIKHFGANGDFLNAKGDVAIDSSNPRVRHLDVHVPRDGTRACSTSAAKRPPQPSHPVRLATLCHCICIYVCVFCVEVFGLLMTKTTRKKQWHGAKPKFQRTAEKITAAS